MFQRLVNRYLTEIMVSSLDHKVPHHELNENIWMGLFRLFHVRQVEIPPSGVVSMVIYSEPWEHV